MAIEIVQAVYTSEFAQYDGTNAQDVIDYLSSDQFVGEIVSQQNGDATIRMSYWSQGVGVEWPEIQMLILESGDWVRPTSPFVQVIKEADFNMHYFIKNT